MSNHLHIFMLIISNLKISIWIAVILSSLDSLIVATIYPQIGMEFKKYLLQSSQNKAYFIKNL